MSAERAVKPYEGHLLTAPRLEQNSAEKDDCCKLLISPLIQFSVECVYTGVHIVALKPQ
jgi:hypothetical protein